MHKKERHKKLTNIVVTDKKIDRPKRYTNKCAKWRQAALSLLVLLMYEKTIFIEAPISKDLGQIVCFDIVTSIKQWVDHS